jgi:hypothetical protein
MPCLPPTPDQQPFTLAVEQCWDDSHPIILSDKEDLEEKRRQAEPEEAEADEEEQALSAETPAEVDCWEDLADDDEQPPQQISSTAACAPAPAAGVAALRTAAEAITANGAAPRTVAEAAAAFQHMFGLPAYAVKQLRQLSGDRLQQLQHVRQLSKGGEAVVYEVHVDLVHPGEQAECIALALKVAQDTTEEDHQEQCQLWRRAEAASACVMPLLTASWVPDS